MYVGVGSTNPVKAAAVRAAFDGDATVEPVAVGSGVSEQPRGERETIQGATNRARRVLESGDYDLGVGLEGGVATVEGADGLFLIMWAAVSDGDRTELGGGTRIRLPKSIADRIHDGEELGPVMDDVLGTENIAEERGAAGALTGNIIDRKDALRHAVAGAMGPFVTDFY